MLCHVCLQPSENVRLSLRDLSSFYAICSAGSEHIEDTRAWVCSFCWTRIMQCVRFINAAKRSNILLSMKCASVQPTDMFPYTCKRLQNTTVCKVRGCSTADLSFPEHNIETCFISDVEMDTVDVKTLPVEFVKKEEDEDSKVIVNSHLQDDINRDSDQDSVRHEDTPKAFTKMTWQEILANEEERAKNLGLELVEFTEEQLKQEIARKKETTRFKNAKFRCDKCGHINSNENYAKKHTKKCHAEKAGAHECNICYFRFKTATALSEHKTVDHKRKWRCMHCNTFVIRKYWSQHGTNCSPDAEKHECDTCHKKFSTKALLSMHKKRTHRPPSAKTHACEICSSKYAYAYELQTHMRTHTGEKPIQCEQCGMKFATSNNLYYHMRKLHAPPEPPEECYCAQCNRYFRTKRELEHHLNTTVAHIGQAKHKFQCGVCPKKFNNQAELDNHVKFRHIGTKDFNCPICNKGFEVERYMKRHMQRHNKVDQPRNHVCDLCGFAFKDKKTLREHRAAVHEKLRPYKCDVCGATFGFSAGLYTHNKQKHKKHNNVPSTSTTHWPWHPMHT